MKVQPAQVDHSPISYEPTLMCSEFYELLGIGEEVYCRSVCHAMKNWGFIGTRKSGKPTTSLSSFLWDSEAPVYPVGIQESVDVFISPNQFFDWFFITQVLGLGVMKD